MGSNFLIAVLYNQPMSPNHHREENVKFAAGLNIVFTLIEIVGGLLTNSLALLADALHDFGDSIALVVAWWAERKAKTPADNKMTFGYHRLSLLSSVFAAVVLISGSLLILSKAIPRLIKPEHVDAQGMILIAVIGLVINSLGFLKLRQGISQNEKILSWHLLEDMLGWLVLLAGSVIIKFWDTHVIDPLMTIGFTVFILWGAGRNFKETVDLLMEGVPNYINREQVKKVMLSVQGVVDVHDLHIWSLEGETNLLTAHVVVDKGMGLRDLETIKDMIKNKVKSLRIGHLTIEFEAQKGKCRGSCLD